ncbi:MAG: hypothetical protein M3N53_01010 [Actinomycetota bacterium]|nr:hypothetical protein [Actinomycetota bacterium]
MTNLSVFASTLLTVVLVSAAWAKLRRPQRFRAALESYRVIPPALVSLLITLVPTLELMFAALQWIAPLQPFVGIAMAAMFAAFTLLLLRSVLRGVEADCGCFGGAARERVSWVSVVRNIVLVGLALATPFSGAAGSASAWLPAALTGLGGGAVIVLLDQALGLISTSAGAS